VPNHDYKMPTLELSPGELSLLKACVALVLGELAATGVSNIIKKKNRKLEKLYSKLEFSQ
jgi:hypothetical protein